MPWVREADVLLVDGGVRHTCATQRWHSEVGGPAYAIEDATAISVVGGTVEVVSERTWEQLG